MSVDKKKIPPGAEPVESLGEVWYLSEVDENFRKAFARPIRMRARQQLLDDKPALTPEQYKEEWEAFQARIDAGAYEWGPPLELGGTGPGKAVRAVLDGEEGGVLLVQALLEEVHGTLPFGKVVDILGGNPEGVAAAMRAAMGLPPLGVAPGPQAATPGETKAEATAATTTPS